MFTEDNIISSYSRENAIADGIFVDVTTQAKECTAFKIPVALTTNLFVSHIKQPDDKYGRMTDIALKTFLLNVRMAIANHPDKAKESLLCLKISSPITYELIGVWVSIEAQSPNNPSPALTILLPEDY